MEGTNDTNNGMNLEDIQIRIQKIESFLNETPVGGMLSSTDFQDLCVYGEEGRAFLDVFEKEAKERNNNWDDESLFLKDSDGKVIKPKKALFYINPFNKLNITPFSYDLAIGNQVYSMKSEKRRKTLISSDGYRIEPRETVIVLTRESIAIPPHYAATVWPRFGPVSEGIFQSMVKIDPTWRGKLAVALTNVSPSTYPIKENQLFATLILYRLTNKTQFTLCDSKDIEDIPLELTDAWFNNEKIHEIERKFKDNSLNDRFYFRKNTNDNFELVVKKGYRKEKVFNKLLYLYPELIWHNTVESLSEKVIEEGKIGKSAYKMDDLDTIISGAPDGERLSRTELELTNLDNISLKLEQAAIEYGGPCKYLPNLPKIIMQKVEEELKSKVQADVEANVFPKMVSLMLSVLGMLSLIIAIIAFLVGKFQLTGNLFADIDWPAALLWAVITIGIVILLTFFGLYGKNIWQRIDLGTKLDLRNHETRIKKLEEKLKR